MNGAISFLVLMVLLFAGMAQSHSMAPKTAYTIAGVCAAAAIILAAIRFSRDRKK